MSERDSLDEREAKATLEFEMVEHGFDTWPSEDYLACTNPPCELRREQARTLINEVKELREENARLKGDRDYFHDSAEELAESLEVDAAVRITELEEALTKQYVEDANTAAALKRRIKQMEEALREVLPLVVVRNGQGDRAVLRAAQLLALSPTDTEEEA
jgi:hypothetical protein